MSRQNRPVREASAAVALVAAIIFTNDVNNVAGTGIDFPAVHAADAA